MENGISGRIAKAFLQSKLSIILMGMFLLLGIFSVFMIPREEEPQIDVPMADIMVGFPGASPEEVETKIARPIEKMVSDIKGVENVYSTSMDGRAMVTVQFYVGEDVERSIVNLYNALMKRMDQMPEGATMPLVKTRSIDDVPVLSLTLWSRKDDGYRLRQVADVVADEIKQIPDVAQVQVIGGLSRAVNILPDKEKMAAAGIGFSELAQALRATNAQAASGNIVAGDNVLPVTTGTFYRDVDEIKHTVVGSKGGQPIYLHEVAAVEDGAQTPASYVSFGYGAAHQAVGGQAAGDGGSHPAVTVSIAKKKGSDAMKLAGNVKAKVEDMKQDLITDDMSVEVTRNYGDTASHKVSELLLHLIVAIVVVTIFVMLAMGWRGGLVVFLSVPITFAMTLFSYYFLGYTLNRITLFALVFVTGIVTDDSIVIAENMYRHFKMGKLSPVKAAVYAVNEVGNPTILATLTVIAAVLPMAFVSGMMGPYMSPMPIGASIAMTFSLLVALTLTPYFGFIFLKHTKGGQPLGSESTSLSVDEGAADGKIFRWYRGVTMPLLRSRKKRWGFMLGLTLILFATMSMFATKSVTVKMLPSDNKNEFQVIIDMPEGTTLERTQAVAQELAMYVGRSPYVENYQIYAGTASPISFNGLVRHYDLRSGDHVADLQVNIVDKAERSLQSHDIAKSMRGRLQEIGRRYGANVKVVEIPPGPPVMATVVAEIYGPDHQQQARLAREVRDILKNTDNVVDTDWSVEDDQAEYLLDIDKDKAMKHGLAPGKIVQEVRAALSGMQAGVLHDPASLTQVGLLLRYPESSKASVDDLLGFSVVDTRGDARPLSDYVTVKKQAKPKSINRKNQQRVVYVMAEVAGTLESPVYAMQDVSDKLKTVAVPRGYTLAEQYSGDTVDGNSYTLRWDGEWKITYEVFRDLGLAFAFVLVIIYILIVGWSSDFITPFIQLSVIPLSLIGIVLGHWVMGAYFSAPSMIGFIALAGIMVRNSILLIDFIDIRMKEGVPVKQAVIEAGAIRATPILLTAGSVVLGAFVILFDPIFQGLAISLIGGTVTSTMLTLVVVPLLYYKLLKSKRKKELARQLTGAPGEAGR